MSRIPFSQVLKNAGLDLKKEYERLFELFYLKIIQIGNNRFTVYDWCDTFFDNLPFRGTCINLDDFNNTFGFHFESIPPSFDIDYLVRFCEYSYNLAYPNQSLDDGMKITFERNPAGAYIQHLLKVIEKIGYMENKLPDGVTDFVPKDQVAISVSEIVDPDLSYRVIEYNHHSMKGDLKRKKAVLLALADKLEPHRPKLAQINKTLENDLFFLFNNVEIRHNNTDPDGKNCNPLVTEMNKEQIEAWYDDTYQMCLLAFLELDHLERKNRIKELKNNQL